MSESVGVVPFNAVTFTSCEEPEKVTVEAEPAVCEKPAVLAERTKSPERVILLLPKLSVAFPVISRLQSKDKVPPAVKVVDAELFPIFTNDPAPDTVHAPEVVGAVLLCTL